MLDLKNNVFHNNSAIYGGAGIYFKDKLLQESPNKYNTFIDNKAFFAPDFYTFPRKVYFQDDKHFQSWVSKSKYTITLIPGITQINLNFSLVDSYGQTIKSVNRFFFSYFKQYLFCSLLSSSNLQLKNMKFEDLKENTTFTGLPYSTIINGFLNI